MGNTAMSQPSEAPPGCWFTKVHPEGRTYHPWVPWVDVARMYEVSMDCDCRLTKHCPPGPPPLPPSLLEFMPSNISDDVYYRCGAQHHPGADRTWNPDWGEPWLAWFPYKGFSRVKYEDPGYREYKGRKPRPRVVRKRRTDPSYDSLFVGMGRREAAAQIYRWAAPDKRAALHRRFGGPDGDTRPFLLALLLAEPDMHASTLIERLPPAERDAVLRCSNVAVRLGLRAMRREAEALALARRATRGDAAAMPAYLARVAGRYLDYMAGGKPVWRRGIADGSLDDHNDGNDDDSNNNSSSSNNNDDDDDDAACAAVYRDAVADFKRPQEDRYVAGISEILFSLDKMAADNELLDALASAGPRVNLTMTGENMRQAFGPAFPDVAVGLEFFTLALHAISAGGSAGDPARGAAA
ncbi:uncharacterized protein UV8b_07855 [Ustilaginoidea virens]|uniref:Uncharacterized protein n=1 Tax=Ustilaginoidea virens TaxID=1159556 RepID=A0A063C7L3_USTVR|nr:uncharacterized protein UV8b_07855 [Ustilaginoidea virens]QUC23614.1 hypothetical protein UV8b_07855 [Ustilaginoidea virens]GAO17550.1 hypothetical protein UVI_02003170 [Ustilaginoidea virens]